jgi:CheY-like chemotaxis protein
MALRQPSLNNTLFAPQANTRPITAVRAGGKHMSDPDKHNDPCNTAPWPGGGSLVQFTILLWEDDHLLRDVLRRTLESFGHIVLQAGTAKEAVNLLRLWQGPIHVFLSEIPEEVTDQRIVFVAFSEKYPLASIVYMSGHNDQFIIGSGNRRNPWFVVKKPFRPSQLAKFLVELVNRNPVTALSLPESDHDDPVHLPGL